MIHPAHWERLASLSPDDVCRRTGARHDPATGCYTLLLLDRHVKVDPVEHSIQWCDQQDQAERPPGQDVSLLTTVYLNEAREDHPAGDWVTEESLLPSGSFFFRGPHTLPMALIADRFDTDRAGFLVAGSRLGGTALEWGDASIQLQVLPRIAVCFVLWQGDEEFRPRVTMLFDRLVDRHIPLDVIFSMAQYVTSAILRAADSD